MQGLQISSSDLYCNIAKNRPWPHDFVVGNIAEDVLVASLLGDRGIGFFNILYGIYEVNVATGSPGVIGKHGNCLVWERLIETNRVMPFSSRDCAVSS